jgi:kynurenine formamidase
MMRAIDLTMQIDERTPVFPGDHPPEFAQAATIEKDGASVTRLSFSSHFGTHIDAPSHMISGAKTLTDFPIGTFVGEAIVLDVRGQRAIDHELAGVKQWDIVFFCTGHTRKAHEPGFFEANPVLSEALARKLVQKGVKIVGLDSFTPDNAPYPVHKILLGADILILENLVGLEELVGKRFECCVMPLKVKDADGAPCRVVGFV